jgi:hypothetical protein
MSTHEDLFEIIIDDKRFILSKETLKRNRQCKLSKVLFDGYTDPCITPVSDNAIFIDRDPESFNFIVAKMRGYNINYNEIKDQFLKEKVIHDIRYFGLIETINTTTEQKISEDEPVKLKVKITQTVPTPNIENDVTEPAFNLVNMINTLFTKTKDMEEKYPNQDLMQNKLNDLMEQMLKNNQQIDSDEDIETD